MKRPIVFATLLLVPAACALTYYFFGGSASSPLQSASSRAPAPLPKDALLLSASDDAEVIAPFQIHDETGAVGGVAAFLPKGSRTEEHAGKVLFKIEAREAGIYHAFVHAKWRDTCSNSCALKVGQGTEITVGNDDVFSVWHWVPAGKHKFDGSPGTVGLVEREDGIYVDQILFTKDAEYVPSGAIGAAGVTREIRTFADTFTRSPGHGNEGWEFIAPDPEMLKVAFSFDPNRIPNQYALTGNAAKGPVFAYVKSAPAQWYGCKMSFTFQPVSDGTYGGITDQVENEIGVRMGFVIKAGATFTFIDIPTQTPDGRAVRSVFQQPLESGLLRINQWHRVSIERWAWNIRLLLDGREVFAASVPPRAGKAGLFVTQGSAIFDDFEIQEIPWLADDGANFKIDWQIAEGAKWFRASDANGPFMRGDTGTISAGLGALPLVEIVCDAHCAPGSKTAIYPEIVAPDLKHDGHSLRLPPFTEGSVADVKFVASEPGVTIQRVALRYGRRTPPVFNIGPYYFSEQSIEDPSDYLDFTEEEYRAMARSPEAAKLQRHAKFKPVIGHGGGDEESPWLYMGGSWAINTREGCLMGRGTSARLRHAQEISSDMEMRFKLRIKDPQAAAEVELYAGADAGVRVQFAPPKSPNDKNKTPPLPLGAALALDISPDGKWHEVSLRVDGSKLSAKIDREPLRETAIVRGTGDRAFLKIIRGAVDFDDVEFVIQRETPHSVLYGFNQPEPDWWREPAEKWIDHGGIACVLASSWISLVAPDSSAIMWHKRAFAPDLLAAFNVEENSEWYGWDKRPNHVHFPFDNVVTIFAAQDNKQNYKLVVNAEQHSATILYRNDVEVARVRQSGAFPMRYIGSHMPFMPRTNRISLVKRGGVLQAIVNGVKVLEFTDPDPLPVKRVGIGGFKTRINFSHVEIRELTE